MRAWAHNKKREETLHDLHVRDFERSLKSKGHKIDRAGLGLRTSGKRSEWLARS